MSLLLSKIGNLFKRLNPNYLILGVYFLLSVLVLRGVLFNQETIGFRHDWAIAETPAELKLWFKHALHAWIDARGGFSISYLSDYLLRLLIGSLAFLNIGGNIISKIILLSFIIFSGCFSIKYFYRLTNSYPASFLASLIYVFNPLTFNKIIAGHINYLLAYALTPLFLLFFDNFQNTPNSQRKLLLFWIILAGIIFAILGIQIQFPILVFFLLLMINLLFPKSWLKLLLGILICGIISFLIHLPWLITLFLEMTHYKNSASATPTLFSWFIHNSSYLYQALTLTGGATDYFSQTLINNSFFAPYLAVIGLLFLLIIFFVLIIKPKRSEKLLFFFFLITSLILSSAKIFPDFTFWLINQSFIFSVFREVYHLTFLTSFCFSLLISFTAIKISRYQKNKNLFLILTFCLLLYISPFFVDGKLINNLQTFSLDQGYLGYLKDNSRTLFLPSLQPLQISSKDYGGFDLSIYYSPNSSISELGYFTSWQDRFATFFQSQLYFNPQKLSSILPRYLDLFNVEQIVLRNDIKSIHDKFTLISEYPLLKKYFSDSSSFENILKPYTNNISKQSGDWSLYNFPDSAKISLSKPCLTTGSWNDFNQIFLLQGQASCNSVFLAKDQNLDIFSKSPVNLFIANNNLFDLWLKKPGSKYLETGVFANQNNDPKKDWVSSEHVWWYDPAFAGYSKLLAFTSAQNAQISIDHQSLPQGQYHLLVETYQQPDGGELNFQYQDWQTKINSNSPTKHFFWLDLGEINFVNPDVKMLITNLNGSNALGLIMFIPSDQYNNENFSSLLNTTESIGLINDYSQTGIPAYQDFDLASDYQTYQNLTGVSKYNFSFTPQKITVESIFNGLSDQNEFATIIYPTDIDPNVTPDIALSANVSNEKIGFWEIGLEFDTNEDQKADSIIWGRLKNNYNHFNIAEFVSQSDQNIDLSSSVRIINIRLQPHKEYSVNMDQQVEKKVIFTLSDLKFYTSPTFLTRLPRFSSQINLNQLVNNPSEKTKLNDRTSFFNPFPATTKQEITTEENKIVVTSTFSSQPDASEFATVIIDTNVDLLTYPYATLDLTVSNPADQFYDLAWDIDSDYDNLIDQKIWVKSINFSTSNPSSTQFFDILNLLQNKTNNYSHPRILAVEILPHKQYNLNVNSQPTVNFTISNLNFYHEAALQSAQKNPLPSVHNEINIPKKDTYNLFLNITSNNSGTISGSLADQPFKLEIGANQKQQWLKVGQFTLDAKLSDLTLITYDQSFTINNLALFNQSFSGNIPSADNQISNFQKLSPAMYKADINLEQPTYILFKESYHPAWQVKVFDQNNQLIDTLHPMLVNGWEQAYFFDKTGKFHLQFEYSLDSVYRQLLFFSLSFISILLVVIVVLKLSIKNPK